MAEKFDKLVSVMERLRSPGGCPWDREQTYGSLARYLLEETYEAFDAIQLAEKTGDTEELQEELGDVLLQVVFHSTIAKEKGDFTIDDVADRVAEKLILRHPHVFEDKELNTADDVLNSWDELKKEERRKSGKKEKENQSLLDEITVHFPALLEAMKLTGKAAKVGFDWENSDQVLEKLDEELDELHSAVENETAEAVEEEIGDLLFVLVNLARKLNVEPETALKKTNRKFRKRFAYIERELGKKGKKPEDSTLTELDGLWNEAKGAA